MLLQDGWLSIKTAMKKISQHSELAEIQVSYSSKTKLSDKKKITSSKDAYGVFKAIWSPTIELREEFYMLLLNRANRVLGWYCISKGGITGTVVDARILFSIALKCLSCGIILAHNHPSGNTIPSESDKKLTQKLQTAGKLLEIEVLDHLIITNDAYTSFADEGLM